jgi:hypothetical protein
LLDVSYVSWYHYDMTTSINLKIDSNTKEILSNRAKKLNLTLSEYVRAIIDEQVMVKSGKNPLLTLVGTLSNKEADDFDNKVKSSRKNRVN